MPEDATGQTEPVEPTATPNTAPTGPTANTFINIGTGLTIAEPDSDFDDGTSETTSLASTVLSYTYENGRRYHNFNSDQYMMPNDEDEQDRLDLTHHIFYLLLKGELHRAPLENPQKVLDLGTGTGIWAIDFADKFPEAHVIGTDISPIQPRWVPPNLEFIVEDFEKDWVYTADTFDYVHGRTIAGCVKDWPRLFQQAFDATKPGGYIEFQEAACWAWSRDSSLKEDSPYMEYLKHLAEATRRTERDLHIYHKLKQWAIDAGLEDVKEDIYFLPLSGWPKDPALKEIGKYEAAMAQEAVEAYGLRLYTQVLGWTEHEAKIHHALVKKQLRDPALHAYTTIYFVYGRKPESK